MNKLLITPMEGGILTALLSGPRPVQLDIDPGGADSRGSILGNIYVGKVQSVAKNINAAFVDIGRGPAGYLSLDKRNAPAPLRCGDELIVQVAREAVKTKAPVLTEDLDLAGRYCVLTVNKPRLSFSAKIRDHEWKGRVAGLLEPELEPAFGLIVRTNAYGAPEERLLDEARRLKRKYHQILDSGSFRTCYSLLMEAEPPYIARLRDTYEKEMDEIVTDDPDIFRKVRDYLEREQPEDEGKLRLYQDDMVSLTKVYSLEKAVNEALQKQVWLKSGGYLVIENTEAMTVIDVNTGKYTGGKKAEETIRRINLEAAEEVARQLRLRNLSGIIVVDFIDMDSAEDRRRLMRDLALYCGEDPVKTTVVDMTGLNLVEITRKKIRRPFYEQWRQSGPAAERTRGSENH